MKVIKGIINVLTTLIIVVGGLFVLLYICGIVPYVVLSGSMEPTIKTGSLCFINKHAKFNNVKEKDIIAFKLADNTLVTHRAISIRDNKIQTKGDHNKAADNDFVTKNSFVGKNIFWLPKLGYVVIAFQSTRGKIILITLVILLLIFGFFFSEKNNKKEENN